LKLLAIHDMFGTFVFEVAQTTVKHLPRRCWLSINQDFLMLLDPETKNKVGSYAIDKISHWESNSSGIKFAVIQDQEPLILICRCRVGKKIDRIMNAHCTTVLAQKQTS